MVICQVAMIVFHSVREILKSKYPKKNFMKLYPRFGKADTYNTECNIVLATVDTLSSGSAELLIKGGTFASS